MEKEYLSGSELRQYLHISTRKMKYLMDHDYIPHEDTGQATHKYRVRREDAADFKRRMETEPGFLSELAGCFNNGSTAEGRPAGERAVIDSRDFQNYLLLLWASLPEALPTQEAARRIGVNPQRLHELIRTGKLHGVKIGRAQYCVKREIIAYAAAPARLAHPSGETYKALVAGYWKEREKQPGDCFAYSAQYELGQRIVSLSQLIMMWLPPYLIVRKHREKTEKGVQLIYAIDSGKNPPLAQNRSFSKHSRFSFLDAFRRIDVALRWPQGVCPAVQHSFQKSLYHNSAACSLILNDDNIYFFAV